MRIFTLLARVVLLLSLLYPVGTFATGTTPPSFARPEQQSLPSLAFSPGEVQLSARQGERPAQAVELITSDGSSPQVSFSEDPDASEWLILPVEPTVGRNWILIDSELEPGIYQTTLFASAEGYTNAQLEITVTVTDDRAVVTLIPERVVTDAVIGGEGEELRVFLANTGPSDFVDPEISITGADAAAFVLVSTPPSSVAPNTSVPLDVRFTPTRKGAHRATLTVLGNGGETATTELRGLGKQDNQEPSLQQIFDVYDLTIDAGDTDPSTAEINLAEGASYTNLIGDEIDLPRFKKASPTAEVTVEVLSVYGPTTANPVVDFGWYISGDAAASQSIFTVDNSDDNAQTLTPNADGVLSFDPAAAAFSFYSNWAAIGGRRVYGENDLNTFTGAIPRHVRSYPIPGQDNAYVIATEGTTTDFEYQDVVVIVRNVAPAGAQPVETIRVNFSDETTPAPVGYLKDYGLSYRDQGSRSYGWVAPNTANPLSLVGNGRNRPPTPDENLLAETFMHMQYDDVNQDNGVRREGSWEIAVPNGSYRVAVELGDPAAEGLAGTRHALSAEGVRLIDEATVPNAVNVFSATAVVTVDDGRLTLNASGGTNTKIRSLVVVPASEQAIAFFSVPKPVDGATDVAVNGFQITAVVNTPGGYELDNATVDGNVKLIEQTINGPVEVPANFNDTGGGDAIALTPLRRLKNSTTYRLEIRNVEANRIGNLADRIAFTPFVSSFTTASLEDTNPPVDFADVSFTPVRGPDLGEGIEDRFTSLVIGPDGKLYATTTGETIKRWTIEADGALSELEVLTPDLNGTNDPVTGQPTPDSRLIIGLAFDPASTAANPIAYVTHSAFTLTDAPAWDGKVTRLSGQSLQNVEDVLIHLPRSVKDHLSNSAVFGPEGDLFIVQGSNTAGGDPDASWGFRRERLLAAAVLRVELDKLPAQLPLSLHTTEDISVINTAPATGMTMSDGTYNPYSSESPVTLYATGIRNGYDLVFHSNGWTYIPTNGTAGNNTSSPITPASADYVTKDPGGLGVRRPNGTYIVDPSIPGVVGAETQKDWLFKSKGGSYHGHPNPYRGEFVLNHGGRPYSGLPGQEEDDHRDVEKYPRQLRKDPNYREVAYDFGFNKSPNGVIEYRSNAFDGRLRGMLLVARFSGQDDIMILQPGDNSGDIVRGFVDVPGLQGLDDPLDVIEDPRTGNLYVSQYDRAGSGNQQLTLLRADQQSTPEAIIAATPAELTFEATLDGGGEPQQSKTVTLTNRGSADLLITNIRLSGSFADQFSFEGTPTSLAPASTQDYTVTYAPNDNQDDLGYQEAELVVESNAGNADDFRLGLYGLKKAGFAGNQEPPLQDVIATLGYDVDVGWTSLQNDMDPQPEGQEISVSLFEAAGPGRIKLRPLARYSPDGPLAYGWYTNLSGRVTNYEVGVLASDPEESQTLDPAIASGGSSFDARGGFFGLYTDAEQSEQINYSEAQLNGGAHRTRIYPARDRLGQTIPNAYLVCFEEATNGDYQDYVYLLSNARPYEAGAQVLSFVPSTLELQALVGATAQEQLTVILASTEINDARLQLSASEPWVVLPDRPVTDRPLAFAANTSGLSVGTHEATVTATAPGFAPATLEIVLNVRSGGAVLRVENMTKVPGTDRGFPENDFLTFHRIDNSVNFNGDQLQLHDRNVLRLHNDGTAPLRIGELTTTATNHFEVISPSIPADGLAVAPGDFVDATIVFVSSGGSEPRLETEELVVSSNAVNTLTRPVTLRGAYMSRPEGNAEISAQQVFESFGFQTEMGRDADGELILRPSSDYPSDQRVASGKEGDMILSEFFVQADPDESVHLFALSALHGTGKTPVQLHLRDNRIAGDVKFKHSELYYQTLLPRDEDNLEAIAGDFTDRIDQDFEVLIAGYRTTGGNASRQRKDELLGVRVYRVIDRDGRVVPNEYIINQDYIGNGCGEGSANCDWNDNSVYLINARPVAEPSATELNDQVAIVLESSQYQVADAFDAGYPGNRLLYSARLAGGQPLPGWIGLTAESGTFLFTPPPGTGGQTFDIEVVATDYNLLEVTRTFTLSVEGNGDDCIVSANSDGGPKTIGCDGAGVRLSGFTSTGTYNWTGPNGFTSTQANPLVTAAGRYTLTASGESCSGSSSVLVSSVAGGPECPSERPSAFWLEAECAEVGGAWTERSGSKASRNRYVVVESGNAYDNPPADLAANRVRFTVDAAAGSYQLFARVNAPKDDDDSFYVRLNGGPWYRWNGDFLIGADFQWNRLPVTLPDLVEGRNTIDFTFREDGTWLDKIYLTRSGDVPSDLGQTASNCIDDEPGDGGIEEFTLEAECGQVGGGWAITDQSNASGGSFANYTGTTAFIDAPPGNVPANRIRFKLEDAKAGSYFLYGRIQAPSGNNDSYWFRVNEGSWIRWKDGMLRSDSEFLWSYYFRSRLPLRQGNNTIDFAFREPGTKLDKLHLNLSGIRPQGVGPEATNCIPIDDRDGDGIADGVDNCPDTSNPDQELPVYYADFDGDGFGDPNNFLSQCTPPADYVSNDLDNCPSVRSDDLTDSDGDGVGDVCSGAPDDQADIVWLEAECAVAGENWVSISEAGASGSFLVNYSDPRPAEPTASTPANEVTFTVDIDRGGNYHAFIRLDAQNVDANSVWVKIDEGAWIKMWQEVGGTQLLTQGFEWRKLNDDGNDLSFGLSAGSHTITVSHRESGTRFDKLSLSSSPVAPEGTGGSATNCVWTGQPMVTSDETTTLQSATTSSEAVLFPNPVLDELNLSLEGEYSGPVELYITDAGGRMVSEWRVDKSSGFRQIQLRVGTLPSGIYRLQIIEGDRRTVRSFAKM